MIKIICSHCGETVVKTDAIEVRLRTRQFINGSWHEPLGVTKEHDEVHLCPKCQEKLGNWLTKAMPYEFNWGERL